MKKLFAVALVLIMVLSLFACGKDSENSTEETEEVTVVDNYPGQYRMGYARVNITPETSTPIAGMGNVNQRMSNDILDQLYMTCIAITGTNDETVIMYSVDNQFGANETIFKPVVSYLAEKLGVKEENISYTCTHTHSAPEVGTSGYYGMEEYNAKLSSKLLPLAVEAMNDRSPATVKVGSIETEGMNFTRHYVNTLEDGSKLYFGDNFNSTTSVDATTQHTRKADPTAYIVTFDRADKAQVVLMNFRMHPHFYTSSTSYKITSDAIGYIREAIELSTGCQFVYFQGAAGNVNNKSRISGEQQTSDPPTYGRIMADYVAECIKNNMTEVKTGEIKVLDNQYQAEANHTYDDVLIHAREVQAIWNATNSQQAAREAGAPYGIRSPYHANAIVSNSQQGDYRTMDLKTIELGENLAWCTSPGETFSESSEWIEENSPYQYTLFTSYSNGGACYLPSEFCFSYTSYETDVTKVVEGTAEKLNAEHVRMLNEMIAQ